MRASIDEVEDTITNDAVEEAVDRALRMGSDIPYIPIFHGDSQWLWKQWAGTIFDQTWMQVASVSIVGALAVCTFRSYSATPPPSSSHWLDLPDAQDPIVQKLRALDTMWNYQLTLTTFVVSFFLQQAYGFWLASKANTRKIQGRLNDVGMLCASHAARTEQGVYEPAAQEMLDDLGRYSRLFHMFFWASILRPARGDIYGASLALLRTRRGVDSLVRRGVLTERERTALLSTNLPAKQWHWPILEWIVVRIADARKPSESLGGRKLLGGGDAVHHVLLDKCCLLRSTCASIPDDIAGRMPMAYVHFVQVLVDSLVALAPFALYPRLGALAVVLAGILTLFYRGFLGLSKSFLDPFGNDDSIGQNLQVETLLGESNNASKRWQSAARSLPFDLTATATDPATKFFVSSKK